MIGSIRSARPLGRHVGRDRRRAWTAGSPSAMPSALSLRPGRSPLPQRQAVCESSKTGAATSGSVLRRRIGPDRPVRTRHQPFGTIRCATGSPSDDVRALLQDRAGHLWVGTSEGLDLLNTASGEFSHYRHDGSDAESLRDSMVMSLYQDAAGLVWIGTAQAASAAGIRAVGARRPPAGLARRQTGHRIRRCAEPQGLDRAQWEAACSNSMTPPDRPSTSTGLSAVAMCSATGASWRSPWTGTIRCGSAPWAAVLRSSRPTAGSNPFPSKPATRTASARQAS